MQKLISRFILPLVLALSIATPALSSVVPDGTITTAKLAASAVTQAKRAALGQQLGTSTGSFSTGSTSFVDVTNATGTLTTTGRPVFMGCVGSGSSSPNPGITVQRNGSGTSISGVFQFLLDGSTIAVTTLLENYSSVTALMTLEVPVSSLWHIDTTAAAGSHTYKLQAKVIAGTDSVQVTECKFIVYEL